MVLIVGTHSRSLFMFYHNFLDKALSEQLFLISVRDVYLDVHEVMIKYVYDKMLALV